MTLDLIGVLSGRDYPTLDIEVYFNEALGFSIYEMSKMLRSVEILGSEDEVKKLDSEIKGLVEKAAEHKYVITLKAIPESVRRKIITDVQEEFPEKTDLLGRPQPNLAADEEFSRRLWRAYLNKITGPDGASKVIDEADVNALLANAPRTVHEQINEGIAELQTGAKAGFEYAAKEMDFLSQASPEG